MIGPVRELIVTEFVTLDGVMEAPGGEPGHPHSGWVMDFMGDEQLEYKLKEVLEADAHLIGRITYESIAGAWPDRDGALAEKMNSMPKYAVTSTLGDDDLEWNNSSAVAARAPGGGRRHPSRPHRRPPRSCST